MSDFALSPWHMWGTSQIVTVPEPSSSFAQFQQTQQLSKVNYSRPDTWSFFFAARLLEGPAGVGSSCDTIIDFDLIIGVGRSNFQIGGQNPSMPGFARLAFSTPPATPAQVGAFIWTSAVLAPLQDQRTVPTPPGPDPRPLVTSFPAQDIQCNARVSVQAASAEVRPTRVEVYAAFAPRVHVRPEWFTWEEGDEVRFRGREHGGT